MSAQMEALEALRGMIDALNNFAPVSVGALPANPGLSIALTAGREGEATLALLRNETLSLGAAVLCSLHQPALARRFADEQNLRARFAFAKDRFEVFALRIIFCREGK